MIVCECGAPMSLQSHRCPKCKVTCECGGEKRAHALMCTRCKFLDGGSAGQWSVISAIRIASGPPTMREIAAESGRTVGNVQHIIGRLRKSGRVRVIGGAGTGQQLHYQLTEPAGSR